MNCSHCGKPVYENLKFCPYCGKEVSKELFCAKCGAKMPAGFRFCAVCGHPSPHDAAKRRSRGKIPASTLVTGIVSLVVILALAAYILFGSALGIAPASALAEKGFDTPEAAVEHYLANIAAGDFNTAAQAFAIEDYARRFDFTAMAKRLKALMPTQTFAPSEYDLYVQANKAKALADLAGAAKVFVYGFFTDQGLDGTTVANPTDADIEAFVKDVDPAGLKDLKVMRIDQPAKSIMNRAEALEVAKKHSATFGAKDVTERVALLNLNGRYYWTGFRLIKYESGWKICGLHSIYANQSILGAPVKTNPAEYNDILD